MLPIRDANPSLTRPIVTWAIIGACIYVFLFLQNPADPRAAEEFVYATAAIPCELTTGAPLEAVEIRRGVCSATPIQGPPVFPNKDLAFSILASMFMHASLAHIFGNLWSLWIFGNNVEDAYGHVGYALFYLASGVVATLGHVALHPDSTVPLVGASGAIAGVMGAYLVLFPTAPIVTIVPPFFFWPFAVPAVFYLAIWFFGQFAFAGTETFIAWEAHVFGFVFGALVTAIARPRLLARIAEHRRILLRTR